MKVLIADNQPYGKLIESPQLLHKFYDFELVHVLFVLRRYKVVTRLFVLNRFSFTVYRSYSILYTSFHWPPSQIFKDLSFDVSHQDSTAPLRICDDEVLGKGGFGFVCKGEIQVSPATAASVSVGREVRGEAGEGKRRERERGREGGGRDMWIGPLIQNLLFSLSLSLIPARSEEECCSEGVP